jgi:hypothetical protein
VNLYEDYSNITPFASVRNNPDFERGGFGGLSFGPNGNVYVISTEAKDVLIFNELGDYTGRLGLKRLESPVGINFYNGIVSFLIINNK